MMLWKKYFLKETIKVFCLFLFSFYFVYVLIDYSAHMQDFLQKDQIQTKETLLYYLCQFMKRANILVPLAALVSIIKVLTTLNSRNELLALQIAGLKIRTLLRPFFLLSLFCTLFLYGNAEFLLPKALNFIDAFHNENFHSIAKREKNIHLRVWHLEDGSTVIYQDHDIEKKAYFDLFWIRSVDNIWHMKYLSDNPSHPLGMYVDHMERNKKGLLEKTQSFPSYVFHDLKWKEKMIRQGNLPVANRSISSLIHLSSQKEQSFSYKTSDLQTELIYKLTIPLLALLIPLAVAPYCISYSRKLPVYRIYAISLLSYIILYAFIDATLILGKNQVIPSLLAAGGPIFLSLGWSSYQFIKRT